MKSFKHFSVISIIVAVLFCLAIAFYWYALRPSNIRKTCFESTKEFFVEDESKNIGFDGFDSLYSLCLNENGLKN